MTALVVESTRRTGPRRPPGWRALARVCWLEHRSGLLAVGGLLAAFALAVLIGERHVAPAYGSYLAAGCVQHTYRPSCVTNGLAGDLNYVTAVHIAANALPVALGTFVGAPLLAREYESGTFRFTWTQSVGRCRFVLVTIALLLVVAALTGAVSGLLVGWVDHPFQVVHLSSKWQPGLFDATPGLLATWSVLGVALGVLLGALVRRTVAAMAATLLLTGGLALSATVELVANLLAIAPRVRAGLGIITSPGPLNQASYPGFGLPNTWLVRAWITGPGHHVLTNAQVMQLQDRLYRDGVYKGHTAVTSLPAWLADHHYAFFLAYQPADRFWIFQLCAVGVLLAVALLAVLTTSRLVRRGA